MTELTQIRSWARGLASFVAVGAVFTGLGCAVPYPTGDNGGTGPNPPPGGDGAVSFSAQIQPIFDANNCIGCHVEGGLADMQGIAVLLVAESSYAGLVNQPSVQDASLTLVSPGDPDASLLYLKVSTDAPPVGSRMPLFGIPLTESEQTLIRDWIAQGAPNN